MPKTIIFATGNKNKMIEIRQILGDLSDEIFSMKEAGIDIDIVEDGTTFEENALIKAKTVADYCRRQNVVGNAFVTEHSVQSASRGGEHGVAEDGAGEAANGAGMGDSLADAIVLADDSGLEIDYLNKEPGIYSARYAGEDTPYEIKNQMLLDRLKGVPREQRTARFVCAIAAVVPGQEPIVVRGTIEGYIGDRPAGENGFGYDPIFYVPDLDCSTAELSPEDKNARSHRGNALRLIRERLAAML